MTDLRSLLDTIFGTAVAVLVFYGASVFAQQADDEPVSDDEEIEEIVVVAPKPGGRKQVDDIYTDPVRVRVLKDLHEMEKDQEEYEWRVAAVPETPSRIRWGYDPTDDYQLRNSINLEDENWGKTKPATLFKVGF